MRHLLLLCVGESRRRRWEFAPPSRESLILPLRGANPSPGKAPAAGVSLRPAPGKALFFRRGAQTNCREKRRRRCEFAPPFRESLILPLRGANPSPGNPPGASASLRPPSRESLILPLRGANLSPGKAPAAVRVCASLPGKPYSSVERRKPFAGKSRRRRCEFAPRSRESLILPSRGANPSPGKAAGASVSLRLPPRKALFFR